MGIQKIVLETIQWRDKYLPQAMHKTVSAIKMLSFIVYHFDRFAFFRKWGVNIWVQKMSS